MSRISGRKVASFSQGGNPMKLNRKGFTLIELLIVIVIIGILVAVLIAVINPARARGRARDAGIQASMNKIALSAQGTYSAYGTYPNCAELNGEITGLLAAVVGAANTCTFGFQAIDNAATNWTYYWNDDPATANDEYFYITRAAEGLSGNTFVYHSSHSGQIYACTATGTLQAVTWAVPSTCRSITATQ